MVILGSSPLPEPTGETPDWTYEELINTFVVESSVDWLESKRKHFSRGIFHQFPVHIVVEEESAIFVDSVDAYVASGQSPFQTFAEKRFWRLDEDGLSEMERAEYRKNMKKFNKNRHLQLNTSFSIWRFCFLNEYRHMFSWSWGANLGGNAFSKSVHCIARGEDGKLFIANTVRLAFN